mgnify:CR=1 FL=1
MILLFVGFPSLTPPVGTPLLQLLQRGAFQMAFGRDTFLQNQKAPFGTPDLRLVTCDLRLATYDLRLATCDLRLATCDF